MSSFGIAQTFSSWYGISIMGLLGVLSVYMVAVAFLRWAFFTKNRVDARRLVEKMHLAIKSNDVATLNQMRTSRHTDPPVKILIGAGLQNHQLNPQELQELFIVTRIQQRQRLNKGLSKFGTIATIAPFLGLLGTVMGIIESFNSLATTGAAGANVVASGVASALWTTAAGLIVAIPSVVFYNIFKSKSAAIMTELDVVSRELMLLFKTDKVPKLKAVNE